MPLVLVSVIGPREHQEKRDLMEAVHLALVEAFGIPAHDHNIRIQHFAPDEWLVPPGKGERYTLVEVKAFEGRSPEAKGRLYAAVVERLGKLGVPAGDVFVHVAEEPRHNWGIRGGQRADQVDLGYEVKV
ncbi:hypothetical protein NNJEOMEG_02915 [Fundidesulfovibrio magnetotacticus]|uniref:Tautomerase enzyme n=1 Tax=Fundidesulfovibrio magnetotacticus TaxID=2730080 RepID=A0A6V8LRE8_9BACT|nr:tautomerase family protein [Fundidesulfovibrio magnetotacticus]GFK95062.1 hypothetical protein NNJEOMEG_02915 [Fundidesulfovibrio magnetotacticus]